MEKLSSFLIVLISVFCLSTKVNGQSDYLYKHNWEAIPISANLYSGTNTGFKIDLLHFRFRVLNIGLFSRFSNQDDLYNYDENNLSISKLGYLLPFGINIPVKQNKNFRLSLNSNFYWTINPKIVELDVRAEKKYFSAFAGYRFSEHQDVKGFYLGASLGFHYFSNNRRLSEIQESEINQALCNSSINECISVDISEKNYLIVKANLRKEIAYTSTFFFIENGCLNFNFIDSLCMNRSVELLNTLYDSNCLKDLAGIEVHLYYGAFKVEKSYDNGAAASVLTTTNDDDIYSPYNRNDSFGFSKTSIINGPFNLYTVKIGKDDFKEVIEPVALKIENKINDYLKLREK